ncbi:hypothetical protein DNX69_15595 [Rhodopseudomonas palustris]|uniref:Uncharacterized protein n=1 Tax=Rhodopseudomonas palustris TaxID=1076 RepID=A0A323UGX8_RHOPL|nr:hypothetical protein [Rhodopseudomonas palustris]PZA10770.1 hypothetical protein DNX69_15595 [Rhodopseudomonas palustris]
MGLYALEGTITQFGQCQVDNDLVVYAYIEVVDAAGLRTLIKKVAVGVDVQALIEPGMEGTFFIDEFFVVGRRILSQLWGVSTTERDVIDSANLRTMLAASNMFRGIVFTPLMGLGIPYLLAGIGQCWSLIDGSGNRRRYFDKAINGDVGSRPGPPLPERLGLALGRAVADLTRRHAGS